MASTRSAAAASAAEASTTPTPIAAAVPHPYTSLSHSIERLDGSMATGKSNYFAWKFRVLRILKEKGLASALKEVPSDDNSDTAARERVNDQAFTIISLNIRDSQIPHIQAARNAKEAWEALAKVHQGIGSNGRMVLMQRLWSLHLKEGQDMSAHLNSFKELSTQVANLSSDGVGIPGGDLVSMLSLSLPQSYEPLIMAVQSRADTISFDFLSGRLLQEATRRQAATSTTTDQSPLPLSAMAAHPGFRGSSGQFGRGNYRTGNRAYGRGGFARGMRGGSSVGFRGRGGSYGGISGRCHYCNKEGHWKNKCLKRKGDLQKGTSNGHLAFMGLSSQQREMTEWIIDLGASRHLTANQALLKDYIKIRPTTIMIGNGKEITAIGQGNITIPTSSGTILLAGVLHVPQIGSNLLSVASIVDHGFRVEFTEDTCSVNKGDILQGIGRRQGKIYYLVGSQEVALTDRSCTGDATSQEIWHRRIGHRSLTMQALVKIKQSVTGLEILTTAENTQGSRICSICSEGKQTRESLTGERTKTQEILHTVHSDICGPMAVTGLMGERYFATFIDERSGRMAIALLKYKSEVFERFKDYQAKVERETGKKIKVLRSDGGGEYTGNTFRNYLANEGITQRITPPYTPEHNGIAERANRTIMEMVRCMLFDSGLGQEFWGYAALTAIHIINRLPGSTHNNRTPFELRFGSPPSISHLRVFGCTVYRQIPAANRNKLDRRAQKCRLIGYTEESGSRVYRVYNEGPKQVSVRRDVVLEEESRQSLPHSSPNTNFTEEAGNTVSNIQIDTPMSEEIGARPRSATPSTVEQDLTIGDPLPPIDSDEDRSFVNTYDQEMITVRPPRIASEQTLPAGGEAPIPTARKSQRLHHRKEMFSLTAGPAYMAIMEEPVTLEEALTTQDAVAGKTAWQSELDSLRKNGTWVMERVPRNRNVVGCRWLFRRKEGGRFKVRLVAKGYSQEPGIDFKETFAPVAKFTTLRVLLALVAENDWELHSMDVKTAFLNGELEEEIFMECPEGVQEMEEPGYACRLHQQK